MRQPNVLADERGSVIAEFIVLAPILILLVYLAMMMNEYVERRQTLYIAARNVAALAPAVELQSGPTSPLFNKSAQKDFFGAELSAADAEHVKVIRDPEVIDAFRTADGGAPAAAAGTAAGALGVLLDARRYYADNDAFCDSAAGLGHGLQFCPYDRESAGYPGPFAGLSSAVGGIAGVGSRVVDTVVNLPFVFNGHDRRLMTQTILSIPGSEGLLNRAVAGLFALSTGANREAFMESAATHYTMSFTTLHYTRPFVGFHLSKDEYTYEFPLGIGIDLLLNRDKNDKWGDTADLSRGIPSWFKTLPGGFATNCMFYYMVGSDCQEFTTYRLINIIIAGVAAIVDVVAKIGGGDSKEAWGEAMKLVQNEGISLVEQKIVGAVTDAAKDKLQGLQSDLMARLTDLSNGPANALKSSLDGAATQFYNCVAADPATSGCQ